MASLPQTVNKAAHLSGQSFNSFWPESHFGRNRVHSFAGIEFGLPPAERGIVLIFYASDFYWSARLFRFKQTANPLCAGYRRLADLAGADVGLGAAFTLLFMLAVNKISPHSSDSNHHNRESFAIGRDMLVSCAARSCCAWRGSNRLTDARQMRRTVALFSHSVKILVDFCKAPIEVRNCRHAAVADRSRLSARQINDHSVAEALSRYDYERGLKLCR